MLVLGGTAFLSRQVAEQALAAGHEVTCACRGSSGRVPDGAAHVVLDRAADTDPRSGPWPGLARAGWDAVVDVARTPSWVATATAALGGRPHWVFVSTISVYAEPLTPGGGPGNSPVLPPAEGDPPTDDPTAYGPGKVACEDLVRATAGDGAWIVRPGLIVGPGDPSGRFTYWPVRLARGGPVLAPRPERAPVQVIDVRDLAAWIVEGAAARVRGTFDATAPAMTMGAALASVAAGVDSEPDLRWTDPAVLTGHDVRPWAGPRSLPLWLPGPELAGLMDRDVSASREAGLTCRPLSDTARDTLAWTRQTPDAKVGGLSPEEERQVLDSLGD
ncbi:SDR family oxidoreductase [Ornithinicoccus hortensis]|uniref:Nucleoside-diphosphate-sugar epimerase n=2 Tax=Ornithinicoccus hortensis TaxID=82346 RepID=A0A542YM75_9MICO|nr:nucleoside-diphosphate-sugar epimerase [Ornithinicoccus hortensis]